MPKQATNYAFIDSQNLHLGIRDLGWNLDYKRFLNDLAEKLAYKKKRPQEDKTS